MKPSACIRECVARAGVRRWSSIIAIGILALGMITAGVVVLALLNRSLVSGAADAALAKARNVAATLAAGGPVTEPALTATPGETAAVQILDAAGQVVRSSSELAGEPPILPGLPRAGGEVVATVALPLGQNNAEYRVAAVRSSAYTVVAAQSLEGARTAVARLAVLLVAAGVPLLALAWLAVHLALGAALGRVEAMRRTVAEVSMTDLAVRVAVPRAQDEIQRLGGRARCLAPPPGWHGAFFRVEFPAVEDDAGAAAARAAHETAD
ncbi:hypothetical protein [Amycolatopsis ultiminotia]